MENIVNTSVTFTLRRPYGGRRTPKSSDSCGCRRNYVVAAGPPYGLSRRGGRRIIARSYNFFHFKVRRRNLTRRSYAVDRTVAVRPPYGHRTVPLRAPCVCLNICHKNYGCRRDALRRPCVITSKDVYRAAAVFLSPKIENAPYGRRGKCDC